MVVNPFKPSTQKQRQVDHCDFKAYLVYLVKVPASQGYREGPCPPPKKTLKNLKGWGKEQGEGCVWRGYMCSLVGDTGTHWLPDSLSLIS